MGQRGQQRQFTPLQLGHKANTAGVDPQNGHPVEGGVPGRMEDGSISAKADQQVGGGQLLVQRGQYGLLRQVQPVPFSGLKGQAQHRLSVGVLQNPPGLQGDPQPFVPVGVGAEYNFHRASSFQALCDCSTRAFRSPV